MQSTCPQSGVRQTLSGQIHLIHTALGHAQSGTYYQWIGIADELTETGDVVAHHDTGDATDQNFTPNHETPVDGNAHSASNAATDPLRVLLRFSRS
jgi:hypothetical protein